MHRRLLLVTCVVVGLVALPSGRTDARAPVPCGTLDQPETGLQGQVPRADQDSGRAALGYNCGAALVGQTPLGGRGGNANMAWAGSCAYVAGTDGVAVVDVHDPEHPVHVTTLHGSSEFVLETIGAREAPGRAVLVAGRYNLAPFPGVTSPVDIYDVSDCANPVRTATFEFPDAVHNLSVSPDATRVFTTQPIQVLDITDLARPVFLGKLEDQIPQQVLLYRNLAHEVWFGDGGDTIYLGGQTLLYETVTIVDIAGWPAVPPRLLSQVRGRGHSVRIATVRGRRFLLHSEESIVDPLGKGCLTEELNPFGGVSEPWLSDVTDPTAPVMRVGEFGLEINRPEHCGAAFTDGTNSSTHYHDVDDENDSTFAMVSMWNSGIRIVDIRHPNQPREVAYFNPGGWLGPGGGMQLDKVWSHVRYVPETGHIWFASEIGGFWVIELEPQVRAALGLPDMPVRHPDGGPARLDGGGTPSRSLRTVSGTAQLYCTLGSLGLGTLVPA